MSFFSPRSAIILTALVGLFAGPAQAQNKLPWTVQSVSGDVRHEVGGAKSALAVGIQVGIGSKVSTGTGARP